jgi:hypothetical protein
MRQWHRWGFPRASTTCYSGNGVKIKPRNPAIPGPLYRIQWRGRVRLISIRERNTMKRVTMILAVAALFIISARGQGFGNLNFESAFGTGTNFPGNPGNGILVSVTNALPDWTPYNGPVGVGGALSSIYYVSNILGHASNVELESGSLALSGNDLSVGLYQESAISQTGLVPTNAESLQFEASSPIPGAAGFSVTLGGQSLSYSVLSEGPDYTDVYGANIPANLDGLTEALTFSCLGNGSGNVLLDDIDFSPMSVPEPSEYALIGLGAILFGLRHLKGRFIYLSRRGTSAHGSSAVAPLDAASLPY